VDVVDDDIGGELIAYAVDAIFETFGVVRGPPVFEIALAVELAAFIVEAMGEFVANGGAGISVVGCVVFPGIVERRLKASYELHTICDR